MNILPHLSIAPDFWENNLKKHNLLQLLFLLKLNKSLKKYH